MSDPERQTFHSLSHAFVNYDATTPASSFIDLHVKVSAGWVVVRLRRGLLSAHRREARKMSVQTFPRRTGELKLFAGTDS